MNQPANNVTTLPVEQAKPEPPNYGGTPVTLQPLEPWPEPGTLEWTPVRRNRESIRHGRRPDGPAGDRDSLPGTRSATDRR